MPNIKRQDSDLVIEYKLCMQSSKFNPMHLKKEIMLKTSQLLFTVLA